MKSLFTSSKKYVIIESPSKKLVYGTKRAARGDIMVKKEMIAMLLAGGQGSRLGVLTQKVAKPAVSFGGKYRIIDFPLSNCINSGVDTVGVLTQYQPLRLNAHIGIGIPWDLDRRRRYGSSALREKQRQRLVYWNRKCDLPESGVHGVLQSGIRSDPFR